MQMVNLTALLSVGRLALEFKTYNLVEEMVKQRQIELVKEESVEDSREKYAKAAKLMGIKVSDKMSLEDIKDAIEAVRAIL